MVQENKLKRSFSVMQQWPFFWQRLLEPGWAAPDHRALPMHQLLIEGGQERGLPDPGLTWEIPQDSAWMVLAALRDLRFSLHAILRKYAEICGNVQTA